MKRAFIPALFLTLLSGQPAPAGTRPAAFKNSDCLECHTDPATSRTVNGKDVPLAVFPTNMFAHSVHRDLDCTDCHSGIKDIPHAEHLPPVNCGACHDKEAKEYGNSIHAASQRMGGAAARCVDCHGSHGIVPVNDANSPVFKFNLPFTCGKCHDSQKKNASSEQAPQTGRAFRDSIHGRGLLQMGLIVAPSCNDCHGVHDIIPAKYPTSPVNHMNLSDTCGKCHMKIEETYDKSVHGKLLLKGDPRGPVCTDCHSAHGIESPVNTEQFKEQSDERCGSCHKDRLEHYRETYHGKAMALGRANDATKVAACFDCHGHHDVLPPSDPSSRLSKQNILATCQQCHPKAGPNFTEYMPHANPLDKAHYPGLHAVFMFMTALLIGVFLFFGAHTLLWLGRSAYIFHFDSKKFHEARAEVEADGECFTRFSPFQRFLHLLVVSSFLLLVLTGMPLKFYYTHWAKMIFDILGGPAVARSLHHFGAIVTFLYFALHLTNLAVTSWQKRGRLRDPATGKFSWIRLRDSLIGPDTMVPRMQDWHDFVAHQKWFFGKGPKPQFDRWTYWEKFDYLAVFWGVAAIGMTGLILWFPVFFTRFLPGWVINGAQIIHSDEALLAAGFIFTIHFFNTHFRLEKFPMDTVIFSGRISKAEMLHERRRWYERLAKNGKLDETRVHDEWARWKAIARTFGYLFFGTGIILLILIIYAMATRLSH